MTTQNLTVTARERDTLLAALRYYQFYRMQGHPFDPRQDHLIDTIAGWPAIRPGSLAFSVRTIRIRSLQSTHS